MLVVDTQMIETVTYAFALKHHTIKAAQCEMGKIKYFLVLID